MSFVSLSSAPAVVMTPEVAFMTNLSSSPCMIEYVTSPFDKISSSVALTSKTKYPSSTFFNKRKRIRQGKIISTS